LVDSGDDDEAEYGLARGASAWECRRASVGAAVGCRQVAELRHAGTVITVIPEEERALFTSAQPVGVTSWECGDVRGNHETAAVDRAGRARPLPFEGRQVQRGMTGELAGSIAITALLKETT